MAKKSSSNSPSFFSYDFTEDFTNFKWSPDFEPFVAQNRKNIESLTSAQKITFENIQNITKRQSEILSQIIKDQAELLNGLMSEGTPEQKITRQAGLAKKAYERSLDNLQEIGTMLSAMNEDIVRIVSDHVQDSFAAIDFLVKRKAA